jgi:hypothetical protein
MSTAIHENPVQTSHTKLRLGEPVSGSDELLGELADIIVDPVAKAVTHLVVEPRHRHLQARLVPIDLVSDDDAAGLTLSLDPERFRQLPRVSFSEFVPLASPIDVGDEWDIVGQTVSAQPYWGGDVLGMGRTWSEQAQVTFDRIPTGECEIRRNSTVVDTDRKLLGHVEGLVVDDGHVGGVVVRTGLPGLHHLIVVPLGAVLDVTGDGIALSIDRSAFDALPSTDDLFAPDRGNSMPSPLSAQLGSMLHHATRRVRELRRRFGRRGGRTD